MSIGYEKWKSWEYLDKVGLMHMGQGKAGFSHRSDEFAWDQILLDDKDLQVD